MATSMVPTVVTGDLWTAANHNTYIRDNINALINFSANDTYLGVVGGDVAYRTLAQMVTAAPTAVTLPMCAVRGTNDFPINNAEHLGVSIGATLINTHGFVVSGNEIEIPTGMGGWYLCIGRILWDPNSTGVRELSISRAGGSDRTKVSSISGQTGISAAHTGAMMMSINAGQKVSLYCWQNSGGILNAQRSDLIIIRLTAN